MAQYGGVFHARLVMYGRKRDGLVEQHHRDHVLQADIRNIAIVDYGGDRRRQPYGHAFDLRGLERMLAADRLDAIERRLDRRADGPLLDVGECDVIALAELFDQHCGVCLRGECQQEIIGPREDILDATPTQRDHILVYVTSPAPELAKLLSSVRATFMAYGFGRDGTEGNITFKKPSLDGFFADLVSARAIIANSGFSLVTEALHLAKPYLAVPVSHQFEQIFNAYWLEKSGYGAYWEDLNKERVESFLYNVPHYRESLAHYPRAGNTALLQKLDSLIAAYTDQ